MGLNVSRPIFHAESFAIGFKSWIEIFFKLWSPEPQKSDFLRLKSGFRLYKQYFHGVMTHQNVARDPIFRYIEFKKEYDSLKSIILYL